MNNKLKYNIEINKNNNKKHLFNLQLFSFIYSNPYTFTLDNNYSISVNIELDLVNLYYYAKNNISNYQTVTSIPQTNLNYLQSGLSINNMFGIFNGCEKLISIPKLNINTSKVTNMDGMFEDCHSLTSLDLSNFDTSKVTDMLYMFEYCSNLTTIHGVIDMKSCTRYGGMFLHCDKLKNVKIKNPPSIFSGEGLSEDQYVIVS